MLQSIDYGLNRDIESALVSLECAVTEVMKFQEMLYTSDNELELVLARTFDLAHRAALDVDGSFTIKIKDVLTVLRLTDLYIRALGDIRVISAVRRKLRIDMLKAFRDTGEVLVASKR